uniref:FBD domain-containing protein n=1 Tax=Oryza rufipogon TaxID=4529 RepID=A0A0E0R5D7_ORYRU
MIGVFIVCLIIVVFGLMGVATVILGLIDGLKIFSLVERLSETTNLCLFAHPGMFIFNRDLYWCPTFNKLKTLELNDWCVDSDLYALFYFLQHSPVLEMLTLHLSKVRKDSFQTTGSYKPLGQLASDRLKKIEINHYEFFDERVRKIFKILSTYVTPLQVYMSARCELIIPLLMLLFCILSKYI